MNSLGIEQVESEHMHVLIGGNSHDWMFVNISVQGWIFSYIRAMIIVIVRYIIIIILFYSVGLTSCYFHYFYNTTPT